MPRYNNLNTTNRATNPTSNTFADDNTTGGMYSYGNYYTWHAAIADLTYNGTNNQSTTGTSLCPAGWHLPIGGRKANVDLSDFWKLSRATIGADPANFANDYFYYTGTPEGTDASKKMRAYPNNFLYSGYFDKSSANKRGSYGRYWSSTSYYDNTSYYLYLDSSSVGPGTTNFSKGSGFSIRCTASDPVTYTLTYDANGGTGAPSSQTTTVNGPATFTVSSTTPTRSGYAFDGWADESGNKYSSGASLTTNNANLTLYAQWIPQYTVVHVNNCRTYSASCSQTASNYTKTKTINLDNNGNGSTTLYASNAWTTISGWKIVGWNTASDGSGTEYAAGAQYEVNGASAGGSISLYAHWAPLYSIQYDGNGADNPNGMGTKDESTGIKTVKQTNVAEGDPVTLLASNFKKAGYGFAGWSTNPNATLTSGDKMYGPMETIEAPAYPTDGTNIITMYAVWVPAEKSDPSDLSSSPLYLQDFTASDCNALTSASFNTATGEITPGSVIALTDKRDDEVYTIAKLADNNCWMIENLRLEHEGTVGNNKNDTSVTNQSLSQGYGGTPGVYGNFVGLANPESANFGISSLNANSIYKISAASPIHTYDGNGTLEDIGSSNYPAYRFPRYNSNNTQRLIDSTTYTQNYGNASSPLGSGTFPGANLYSYGNYYTWAAAMANTNYYIDSSTSEAANTSICPSNWHLPSSGTTTKEYGVLSQRYGGTGNIQMGDGTGGIMSNRFRAFPNNFLISGHLYDSVSDERGSYGYYWSRSADYYNGSYSLNLHSAYLDPSYGALNKTCGFSVRCLIGS